MGDPGVSIRSPQLFSAAVFEYLKFTKVRIIKQIARKVNFAQGKETASIV